MTTATPSEVQDAPARPPTGPMRVPLQVRLLRIVGWTLISAGAVVLLYLVYSLLFTNLETSAAQSDLADRWAAEVLSARPVDEPSSTEFPDTSDDEAADTPEASQGAPAVDVGAAQAVIEFVRPGSDTPIVREDPLYIVEGVSVAALRNGPGHYPGTANPGEDGNFAVAGHRTTYGAPFFSIEELVPGDEIHATGRDGVRHVYVVREQQIVRPSDTWVIGPDPLETGNPTLTLTSCHPRFSQAQRIIVFAELLA